MGDDAAGPAQPPVVAPALDAIGYLGATRDGLRRTNAQIKFLSLEALLEALPGLRLDGRM